MDPFLIGKGKRCCLKKNNAFVQSFFVRGSASHVHNVCLWTFDKYSTVISFECVLKKMCLNGKKVLFQRIKQLLCFICLCFIHSDNTKIQIFTPFSLAS